MRLHYPRFYFNVMRSINILSVATVEAAAYAQQVVRAVSLIRPTVFFVGCLTTFSVLRLIV
jgi:hypothetical protein